MRRKFAGGRPRPLRALRGGKANCSRFHCSSVRSVGYKVVFCILPYSKPRLDIRCPRTQKDQKMIFQTRSKRSRNHVFNALFHKSPFNMDQKPIFDRKPFRLWKLPFSVTWSLRKEPSETAGLALVEHPNPTSEPKSGSQ